MNRRLCPRCDSDVAVKVTVITEEQMVMGLPDRTIFSGPPLPARLDCTACDWSIEGGMSDLEVGLDGRMISGAFDEHPPEGER